MLSLPDFSITEEDVAAIALSERLILDDKDRINVLISQNSIDVQACPGSGKTTLIAVKLMLLAQKWPSEHRGICVLSHTNVAKDQIIDRLTKSNVIEAGRLLAYPHFIGTIQEFVNRFLALPYLRSRGISDFTIDNDEYVEVARRLLRLGQFAWLRGTLNGLRDVENQDSFLRSTFRVCRQNGTEINISRRPRAWQRPRNLQRAVQDLSRLKSYLEEQGVFLFRDMYTQAQIAASQNNSVSESLMKRFPYLFIDEMQDTQKFQDDLLQSIFHLGVEDSVVQRFGDPDQAIFNGFGNEEPNESFNAQSVSDMDFVINRSHRFDNVLAEKIKPLSLNEISLETALSDDALAARSEVCQLGENFEHTVIIFDDTTQENVVEHFANIVSNQFLEIRKQSSDFKVRIVGAVGNEIDPANATQMKIGHYWSGYNKANAKTSFKASSLIEAVWYCRLSTSIDWASSYNLLVDCVLKLLKRANSRDGEGKYFSAVSLREALKANGQWQNFRKTIYLMLNGSCQIDAAVWDQICTELKVIFDFGDTPAEVDLYLEFTEPSVPIEEGKGEDQQGDNPLISLPENALLHSDGFRIEISTIHGVKGETHDATLIVATKNHRNDLEVMLPFFTGELPTEENTNLALRPRPHHNANPPQNKQFLRQLYVAASRPRYLLCLAIHKDHISDPRRQTLLERGWNIKVLYEAES